MTDAARLFFVGLHPTWQRYKWLPDGINVMFSAGAFTRRLLKAGRWPRWPFFPFCGHTWLDGGGFTLLNKYGRYPFGAGAYFNLIAFLRPRYYATLDYPCEPEISRALGLMSNRERIEKTVDLAKECSEYESMVGGEMVPVIQGYSLDEYRYCIDLYHRRGLIRDYMAVGSMCRRLSSNDLQKLIVGIHDYAQQAGVTRLHFFGLGVDRALLDLTRHIWSRDSAAILDDRSPDLRAARGGRRFPRGQTEKQETAWRFFETLDEFGLRYITDNITGRVPLCDLDHPDAGMLGDGQYIDQGEYIHLLESQLLDA